MLTSSDQHTRGFEFIKTHVCGKLNELSPKLTYHNLAHTLDVTEQCERIAKEEGVNDERQVFLLKVAALYHDTGFLCTYANHEEMSCEIFLQEAEDLGIFGEETGFVTKLIMATKLPQRPTTLLEQVICDADLDYLGRDDFFEIADGLKREFIEYGVIASANDWDALQLKFLSLHQYHTQTSRRLREEPKQKNIEKLP
jgi:HD superfamily phosphodiesterase